ncbi:UNVERIFIED_CONTAM: hypothetical protein RMT77_001793 [Armadillidium vulgare]
MIEDATSYMQSVLESYRKDGLHAIAVTDRDGVPLLKVADAEIPEHALRQNFLSTFGMATDQANKLGIGKSKLMVFAYSNIQIILFNKHPLLVTLIASVNANTGLLLKLEEQLHSLVSCLSSLVDA